MIWQRAIQIASATDIPDPLSELNFNMKKKPGPTAGFFHGTRGFFGASSGSLSEGATGLFAGGLSGDVCK